jgi:hypothetical protein
VKLPYRAGDSLSLPLGDGTHAWAGIERADHHAVQLAVGAEPGDVRLRLRAYDTAIVLHRWRVASRGTCAPAPPLTADPLECAHAERRAANALGALAWSGAPQRFVASRRPATMRGVRASGAALLQPAARREEPLERLILGAMPPSLPSCESVRELEIDAAPDIERLAAACPNVRHLRIAARDAAIDAGALRAFARLQSLDLSGVRIESLDALADLTELRRVRLARARVRTFAPLAGLALTALAIEHVDAPELGAVAACASLEELELRGFWQLELGDVSWVHALPRLVRAYVDLGGRRKNVELNRRAQWAYPRPYVPSVLEVAVPR